MFSMFSFGVILLVFHSILNYMMINDDIKQCKIFYIQFSAWDFFIPLYSIQFPSVFFGFSLFHSSTSNNLALISLYNRIFLWFLKPLLHIYIYIYITHLQNIMNCKFQQKCYEMCEIIDMVGTRGGDKTKAARAHEEIIVDAFSQSN